MNAEPRNLEMRASHEAAGSIVELEGEVDLRTAPQLRIMLLDVLDRKAARIILDLSGVRYIDSSGVGTIVELKRRAMQTDSKVVLVGLQPRVRSLFEITRLDKFFIITDSLDEARRQ
jgi:anti-sigma B factor antagonist